MTAAREDARGGGYLKFLGREQIPFDIAFDPEDVLDPGDYFVRARVTLEDGTVLDDAEVIFTLQEPYLPSVPSAPSQKLFVGGAAVVLAAAVLWFYIVFLRKKRSKH